MTLPYIARVLLLAATKTKLNTGGKDGAVPTEPTWICSVAPLSPGLQRVPPEGHYQPEQLQRLLLRVCGLDVDNDIRIKQALLRIKAGHVSRARAIRNDAKPEGGQLKVVRILVT